MFTQKSTIVRIVKSTRLAATRTAFGSLERLHPALGARWAARLWLTIPQYRGRAHSAIPPGDTFTTTLGDRRITGTAWGAAGPPVYLVHGWGGTSTQLLPFVTPLLSAGHRVITFDALSHGASDPGALGPRRTTIPEMARALTAVVEEHGQPHAVIAHSIGAASTFFALRGGLRPATLVFLAPMGQPTELTKTFAAALGFGERVRHGMVRRVETIAGTPWTDFDIPAQVTRITPPPLLTVHDPADRETRYADSVAIARRWPNAELRTVTDLGHWRILRDPATISRAVEFVTAAETRLEAV